MYNDKNKTIHVWQSLIVLPTVGLLSLLEVEISVLHNSLVATPFLAFVTFMSILGDYVSGILTIILSTISISFISPQGWHFTSQSLVRTIEFLLASVVIYLLSWRSRRLTRNREDLEITVSSLKKATLKLKSQVRLTKKDVTTLRQINSELQSIVDNIMSDQGLWAKSVEKDVSTNDNKATIKNLKNKKKGRV